MKKILVLVQNYPNNDDGVALMYVHVRNKYYIQHDIDVTVLNFSSHDDYVIDNIKVITEDTYKKENKKYDVVVCHAANIKNHYRFLRKYDNRFEHMIFFFHGHEVLMTNEVYPKPYDYMKKIVGLGFRRKIVMISSNYHYGISITKKMHIGQISFLLVIGSIINFRNMLNFRMMI